ncbi:MAG: hypothetical protein KBE85_07385, partial [Bacteroides sp.]|nr:hypothetical protein [Bacteroides sp.]
MYTLKFKNIQAEWSKFLLVVTLMLVSNAAWAQELQTLRGRVLNVDGDPIAGAAVNVAEASKIA